MCEVENICVKNSPAPETKASHFEEHFHKAEISLWDGHPRQVKRLLTNKNQATHNYFKEGSSLHKNQRICIICTVKKRFSTA